MEEDQQQRAVLAIFAQMVYSSCCNTAHPCHHTGVKAIWVLCVTGTLRAIMTPHLPMLRQLPELAAEQLAGRPP